MLTTAIGVSDDIDAEAAIQSVIEECSRQLEGRAPQAGILFISCMEADLSSTLRQVKTSFPGIKLIGCTTDGEITPVHGFSEDSFALLLLAADDVEFSISLAENISKTPHSSIKKAFEKGCQQLDQEPLCAIVLPDGLTTASTGLDQVMRSVMGETFPIFGGTAGDHFELKQTWQFFDDRVYSDAMPMLLIAGNIDISASVFTGPVPYGDYYEIEHSDRNTIYRINNQTCLEFYSEQLGQFSAAFTNFPLAVYVEKGGHYFLRNPFHVNEEDGSVAFLGTFPEGSCVRLSQVLREDILHSAEKANKKVLADLQDRRPELILVFSCTARRHVLGSETNKEFSILRQAEQNVPFFGFYCYGEIGPFSVGLPTQFHNDTFASVALSTHSSEKDHGGF